MKIIVCGSCEAEFQLKHSMDEAYYQVKLCPFCGAGLEEELVDDIEWDDDADR